MSNPFPRLFPHRGFTLIELLTVIAIMGVLMSMIGGAMYQSRRLVLRARAETQLREMVAAWIRYYDTLGEFPQGLEGKKRVDVTVKMLDPLTDSDKNDRGVVFLNVDFRDGENDYLDPWGKEPFRLSFRSSTSDEESNPTETALRTSVTFPNRNRRTP